ncbi:MAG: hypothetical protein K0S33_1401 [Bacteroidetes bacterium]|jgi:hypothetical protein|nr:hypothetical protein [Bacteroidota bacterium]
MLQFPQGFFFPFTARIFSGILMMFALLAMMNSLFFGILLVFIFALPFTVHKGAEFDRNKNSFRTYVSVYGIRAGKWLSLDDFPHICLLRRNYQLTTGAVGGTKGMGM